MPLDRQPPFERSACAWESNLIVQCGVKGIEVWTMDLDDYVRGDISAMDDSYGSVATNDTWMSLERFGAQPLAMLIEIRDLLSPQRELELFETLGVYPNAKKDVIELEAFCNLAVEDEDRRALRDDDSSSPWVQMRRMVEQRGAKLVETRVRGGASRMSIRLRLDRDAISPRMTIAEIRDGGLIVIFERVAAFAQVVADAESGVKSFIVGQNRGSSGCYVATAVYGSYDCPQVRVLRRWRDQRLLTTPLGRRFVATYYAMSPHLVRRVGHHTAFAATFRPPLEALVRHLRRAGISDAAYRDRH
ncbi:CFI-box-CTERM domain-containing protein [Microbacterium sp. NPDC019599]|uniref:CFI-box-CTERM domain-containing protein n=1 Tax=Microbacterium sp. NPDC019599 TaxID=3154690 RepID=UPI0033C8B6E2